MSPSIWLLTGCRECARYHGVSIVERADRDGEQQKVICEVNIGIMAILMARSADHKAEETTTPASGIT